MQRLIILTVGRNTSARVDDLVGRMCGEIRGGLPPQLTDARATVAELHEEIEFWETYAFFMTFEAKMPRSDIATLVVLLAQATTIPGHCLDSWEQNWTAGVMQEIVRRTFPCRTDGAFSRLQPLRSTSYTGGKIVLRFDRNECKHMIPRARIETRNHLGGNDFSPVTEDEVFTELARLLDCPLDVSRVTTYFPPTPTT